MFSTHNNELKIKTFAIATCKLAQLAICSKDIQLLGLNFWQLEFLCTRAVKHSVHVTTYQAQAGLFIKRISVKDH